MKDADEDPSHRVGLFFDSATQYYISGRFAVLTGLTPVAGNLLHHAIEMYLKGALSRKLDLDQLRILGHNLPKIWKCFKTKNSNYSPEKFDALIYNLHKFEDLRYPNSILLNGMSVKIDVKKAAYASKDILPTPTAIYELCLEEIDDLVMSLFAVASRNPKVFYNASSQQAQLFLCEANDQKWDK